MRILMVLDHSFPPDMRVENEALSLVEAGFEVAVLAIGPSHLPSESDHRGIRILREKMPAGLRNKMRGLAGTLPFYEWYLDGAIRRADKRFRADALHLHDLYLFGGGIRAARRLGVPAVGDLHENYVDALQQYAWSTRPPRKWFVSIPRWRRLEKKWVNEVDRLVVVIEEAAIRNRELGVPKDRIIVVPNTIQIDRFSSIERGPVPDERFRDRFILVYTGGVDLHRGLESVVDAMPAVLEEVPNALLVIVGAGKTLSDLRRRVDARGVTDAVHFSGWLPASGVKSHIEAADLCLIPHLKSGHTDATIPHKLFHYMYLQRPVVSSNCEPLRRIIEETACGRVYASGNAEAFAAAIVELARDADSRMEMGLRGRAAVLERYNWDMTARGLVTAYRTLLGR